MAETTLADRYKQYKAGTTKLVSWIINTAKSCRDITSILSLPGDAKQSFEKAEGARAAGENATAVRNVAVTTSQLLSLAKVVAQAQVKVPDDIIKTTKAVIAGRQRCAEWYASFEATGDNTEQRKNQGHQHFINILKDIQTLLAKAPDGGYVKKLGRSLPESESATDNSLANTFSCLHVDEPVEDALESASAAKAHEKQITFELEDSENEKSFAVWCLLQDIRDLRHQVRDSWMEYKAGKLSFSTAAMVTTVATSLARFAEQNLVEQYKDFWSFAHVLLHMNLGIVEVGKDVWLCSKNQNRSIAVGQQRFCNDEIAELLTPRAFSILNAFWFLVWTRATSMGGELQASKKCFTGFHRYGSLLESIIPDLELQIKNEVKGAVLGESLLGLLDLMNHPLQPITISMVAACQINMDIADIVGPSFKAGLLEQQERVEADQTSVYMFLRNWDLKNACMCETSIVTQAMRIKNMLNALAKDPYQTTRKKSRSSTSTGDDKHSPPFKVYQALPIISGEIINLCASNAHYLGLRLCNWGSMVLSVAYLYRAALKVGALTTRWSDMDFVIDRQSAKRPFVLEPETGTTSMAKCFGVALGVKLTAFKNGQRPRLPKPVIVQQNARKMSSDSPLERALDAFDQDPTNRDIPFVKAAIQSLESLEKDECKDEQLKQIYDQHRRSGKLSPSQLLLAFKKVFMSHEMDMSFDYINFFFTCARIMDSVRSAFECCLAELSKQYPADFDFAHELVYAILWDKLEAADRRSEHSHSILLHAGKILASYIESEGSKFSDLARSKTSGHSRPPPTSTVRSDSEIAGLPEDLKVIYGLLSVIDDKSVEATGADIFCSSEDDFKNRAASVRILLDMLRTPDSKPPKGSSDAKVLRLSEELAKLSDEKRQGLELSLSQLDDVSKFIQTDVTTAESNRGMNKAWSGKWKAVEHTGDE